MFSCKASHVLKRLVQWKITLLLLSTWASAIPPMEKQDCPYLSLPNLNADAIIIGKVVRYRANENSIDVVVIGNLKGTLVSAQDCWQPYESTLAVAISASSVPYGCRINDEWPVDMQYILSLSANSTSACPSLMYDGVHSPVLPAYLSEERVRRQTSICKFIAHDLVLLINLGSDNVTTMA